MPNILFRRHRSLLLLVGRLARIASRELFLLWRKHGGHDLADGSTATRANLKKREYHHLFPDAHLTRLAITDDKIYLSVNCALVTWQTNRNISDKNPERYLAERRAGSELGDAEVKARLATHLIPFEELVSDDYASFLKRRASLVHAAMLELCSTGGS